MFGYIVVHKPELKVREYEAYHACYCGLCRSLKKRYGRRGQVTLSFDMTFLALLLSSLYEPETQTGVSRCLAHPLEKHAYRSNPYFDYAADMNVLLTYYKCMDDWKDERKLSRRVAAWLLEGSMRKIRRDYGEKVRKVEDALNALSRCEKEKDYQIDKTAGFFGEVMAELFVYRPDEWEEKLRRMGFFFGKFIYLMDAYEDIEEDVRQNRYNPLTQWYGRESFEEDAAQILKMMMAETAKAFEQLPILEDAGILRNILYAGVWSRYGQVHAKRKGTEQE